MKNRFLFILLTFFTFTNLFAKEQEHTPYSIYLGGNLNYNMYLSDFKEIPGYTSYAPKFDFADGFGLSGHIGFNYKFQQKLYNLLESIDLKISFEDVTAKYTLQDKFANIISGNKVYDGISEHNLNPEIQWISFSPGIKLDISRFLPVNIRFGLLFSYAFNNGFYQSEKIISPDFINDINTKTKIRYEYQSNEIPNFNNFIYGLSFGFDYSGLKIYDNFYLSPTLNFNYTLNNFVKDLDWKYIGLQLGFNLSYKIPKPDNIPPKPAPLPELPEPIKPAILSAEINSYLNGKKLNNDTIYVEVKEKRFITTNFLVPIIFYKLNTSNILELNDKVVRAEEKIQSKPMETIAKYLKNVNSTQIDVSYLEYENPDTIETRIRSLLTFFEKHGISKNKFIINKIPQKVNGESRKELLEDKSYIKFNLGNENQMLHYMSDTTSQRFITPKEFGFNISVSHIHPYKLNSSVFIDDSLFLVTDQSHFYLDIDNNNFEKLLNLKDQNVKIISKVTDIFFQSITKSKQIHIKPNLIIDKVYENVISDYGQENYVQQYLLGYFEFDKADFISINQNALESIKKAIDNGQFIEIIPLYDFLGTEEHNKKLALARADATIKLLGLINNDNMKITIPDNYFFSNDNPYGRMMNRSVIVRVKNIH